MMPLATGIAGVDVCLLSLQMAAYQWIPVAGIPLLFSLAVYKCPQVSQDHALLPLSVTSACLARDIKTGISEHMMATWSQSQATSN